MIKQTHPNIWLQSGTLRQWNLGAEEESILLVPASAVEEHTIEKETIKKAIEKCFSFSENKWTDIQIKEFLFNGLGLK
jgi:hypothetical protein